MKPCVQSEVTVVEANTQVYENGIENDNTLQKFAVQFYLKCCLVVVTCMKENTVKGLLEVGKEVRNKLERLKDMG